MPFLPQVRALRRTVNLYFVVAACSREGLLTEPTADALAWTVGTTLHAPNVWTGCHSQVRECCRKSLICIRPVSRRAGRGLDGNTHAPLISLADRPTSSHSGHQIQGASIDPFHAAPQSRTRSRRRLNRRGLKVAIEGLAVAQDAPGDARELVGQGNGKFVLVQSARCSCEPSAEAIPGPIMRAHQENLRRLDQQRAQVLAAPLGDATQDG